MTRPDPLTPTVALDQPSETEPAIRLRRYSADTTGDILEVTDEDGAVIQGIKADGTIRNANGGSNPFTVVRQSVAFNSAGILTGFTFHTPAAGLVLLPGLSYVSIPTTIFNGTTPRLYVISEGDDPDNTGEFIAQTDATILDGDTSDPNYKYASAQFDATSRNWIAQGNTAIQALLTDGNGGNPGSTAGAANIVMVFMAAS